MRAGIDLVDARGEHMPDEAIELARLSCARWMLADSRAHCNRVGKREVV
jgi:hypothetical protein